MTPALIDSAVQLADVLARENAALAALDLAQAASMVPEKTRAAAAFTAEQARLNDAATPAAQSELARQVAARLKGLAEENRRLLERGIALQGRLIGCIARAVPRAAAPRYRANGALAGDRARPVALSARA